MTLADTPVVLRRPHIPPPLPVDSALLDPIELDANELFEVDDPCSGLSAGSTLDPCEASRGRKRGPRLRLLVAAAATGALIFAGITFGSPFGNAEITTAPTSPVPAMAESLPARTEVPAVSISAKQVAHAPESAVATKKDAKRKRRLLRKKRARRRNRR